MPVLYVYETRPKWNRDEQDADFLLMESKLWPIWMPPDNLLIYGASWIKGAFGY